MTDEIRLIPTLVLTPVFSTKLFFCDIAVTFFFVCSLQPFRKWDVMACEGNFTVRSEKCSYGLVSQNHIPDTSACFMHT